MRRRRRSSFSSTPDGMGRVLWLQPAGIQRRRRRRPPVVPILLLLDRTADVFLARRYGVDGWIFKPLDAFRLRRAARTLLAGEDYQESPALAS